MTLAADLDHAVEQHDPDRWLASRFVGDAAARADLMALYARTTNSTARTPPAPGPSPTCSRSETAAGFASPATPAR